MEWSTSDVLRFVALALLLLLSTLLLRDYRRDRSAQASLAVCLGGACHLVQVLLETHAPSSPWLHPLVLGGLAVPAAFWVLARSLQEVGGWGGLAGALVAVSGVALLFL